MTDMNTKYADAVKIEVISYQNDHELFVDSLLLSSYETNAMGIAFPRGDLEDYESELRMFDLSLGECLSVIWIDGNLCGVVGIIRQQERTMLLGPILLEEYHTERVMNKVLELILTDVTAGRCAKITCNPLKDNTVLVNSLLQAGFACTSSHIAMHMHIDNDHPLHETQCSDDVITLSARNTAELSQVNDLLNETLFDEWREDTLCSLYEYLEDGFVINTITTDGKLAGVIIWAWFSEQFCGRVEYLAVGNKFRRNKYGTSLLQHVLREIHKNLVPDQHNLLHLDLLENNEVALNFYLHSGFTINYYDDVYAKLLVLNSV